MVVPIVAAVLCAYFAFVFIIDRDIHRLGGRRNTSVCSWRLWELIRSYFPSEIVVESDASFNTSQSYFFCVHPHGILSIGALSNFVPENSGFRKALAQIDARICGLKLALMIPFFRELLLALGFVSASAESLKYLARRGQSAMLVVGGAEESLYAHPGSTSLVLKKRKGFVKLALETGAQLVPVYVFGENELFDQISVFQRVQRWLQKIMTFAMPLFYGKLFLPFPYARRLVTVIGRPVFFESSSELPFDEKIRRYHESYIQALKDLFDRHVTTYGSQLEIRTGHLNLVQ